MESQTKRVELLPAKRRAMILDHLRVNGAASIQALAEAIGGSGSTIRRDLDHLMEGGYLERTHGGAVLLQPLRATFERDNSINAQIGHAEKVAIGAAAALRLNPRDSVILDSSSTVMEAVRAAATRDIPLTMVTNSLEIALFCADVPHWRVIMPGGTVRPGFKALAGEPGEFFPSHFARRHMPDRRVRSNRQSHYRRNPGGGFAQASDDQGCPPNRPSSGQFKVCRTGFLYVLRPLLDRRNNYRRARPCRCDCLAQIVREEGHDRLDQHPCRERGRADRVIPGEASSQADRKVGKAER